jgi:multicomponent K+:H+ antiporter subunit D
VSHWIIAPVLLPAILGAFIVLTMRGDLLLQRIFGLAGTVALTAICGALLYGATVAPPEAYFLGDWPAPFGIVLVLDRLSALMVTLTAILALVVQLYAIGSGWDARGKHFHALVMFQLMGLCGAFLTGDMFNLFVFFEVLLIASYGLMIHAGGKARLRAGVQYVAFNLVGSTLFLFALATLYSVTGTLNMADLALRAPAVAASDAALLKTGALLLFLVFAIKAALAPLHWWLPTAYSAASAPAAALFAVMTKVGAYSIIRIYTLIFGADAGPVADVAVPWVTPAAIVTLVIGAVGVLASRTLAGLIVFAVLWSMGSLLVALGGFDQSGVSAALYYAIHSTLAAAALFLLADVIAQRRGPVLGQLKLAPPVAQATLLGAGFFLAAIAMSGMPPLSGFIGKLLILDATRAAPLAPWIWAVMLITSLAVIIGFSRAGSLLFWKAEEVASPVASPGASGAALVSPAPMAGTGSVVIVTAALATTALLAAFAGPVTRHMDATAAQILERAGYVGAVLGPEASAKIQRR